MPPPTSTMRSASSGRRRRTAWREDPCRGRTHPVHVALDAGRRPALRQAAGPGQRDGRRPGRPVLMVPALLNRRRTRRSRMALFPMAASHAFVSNGMPGSRRAVSSAPLRSRAWPRRGALRRATRASRALRAGMRATRATGPCRSALGGRRRTSLHMQSGQQCRQARTDRGFLKGAGRAAPCAP